MKTEEKRRKFHESLIHMLYPRPPSPPQDEKEAVNVVLDGYNLNQPQELEDQEVESLSSDGDEDEDECGSQKLTRAQRKRLRKKKLGEAASRRRKVIGPLLPTTIDDATREAGDDDDDNEGPCENDPQDVRRNAPEKLDVQIEKTGELDSSSSQNKIKQRRMAKKLAKEKPRSSAVDNHNS